MAPTASPRTLTDMLRRFDDDTLVGLLIARTDLASPEPRSFSEVAARATTRHSVAEAVNLLNAFEIEVARRIVAAARLVSVTDVAHSLATEEQRAPSTETISAIDRLRSLALVWGDDSSLRPVRALQAVLGPQTSNAQPGSVVSPRPPVPTDASYQSPSIVAKVAAGSAFELVRRMDVLLEHCAVQPVQLRRDGSVAAREVMTVAELLDVPGNKAQWYLELAEGTGLLGVYATDGAEALLPSAAFSDWRQRSLAEQWRDLAQCWRDDTEAREPVWLKQLCLAAFGDPAEGRVLSGGTVRDWVGWHRPRLAATVNRLTDSVLGQATDVGLLGLGALACFAVPLDALALEGLLPGRTDEILLQADMTAVAPGPLTAAAARELGTLADIESRGGATVYRFTGATLQRGLAQGWDPDRILALLEKRSRTPVPQPLEYLIHDTARAAAVNGPPAGYVAESSGRARTSRPGVPRTPVSHDSPTFGLDLPTAAALVAALRSAETVVHTQRPRSQSPLPQLSPVEALREAAETGETVWVSAADGDGRIVERLVTVEDVDSGALRSVDARSGDDCSLPVRRILAAHIVRRRKAQ